MMKAAQFLVGSRSRNGEQARWEGERRKERKGPQGRCTFPGHASSD